MRTIGVETLHSDYLGNVMRDYGSLVLATGSNTNIKYQGKNKFEDIQVGMKFINVFTDLESEVTALTSSSIEMFNLADVRNKISKKDLASEGLQGNVVRLRGISSKNWYTLDEFNRKFKAII